MFAQEGSRSQRRSTPRPCVRDHDGEPRLQRDREQPERSVRESVMRRSANSATNYFAVGHPSLTNYLEVVGGSNFGVQSDNGPDWHNGELHSEYRAARQYHHRLLQSSANGLSRSQARAPTPRPRPSIEPTSVRSGHGRSLPPGLNRHRRQSPFRPSAPRWARRSRDQLVEHGTTLEELSGEPAADRS